MEPPLPHAPALPQGLMSFRIREVLLVASDYDSYILEEDGQLAESLDVEFYQLKLSWAPRILTAPNAETALELLETRPFDLVITMSRLGGMAVQEFGRKVKARRAGMPVVLLADNPLEAARIKEMGPASGIDQSFVWRGDVAVFLAIIKYIEDRINVRNDARLAGVRVILLIENSVRFYSAYLPLLYQEVMKQTNSLMADGVNTQQRLRRMKARAKILLAETFEDGWRLFEEYKEFLLGIVTDARFPRAGVADREAGLEFVRRAREVDPDIPALVQSTDEQIGLGAAVLGAAFVNKRSPRLLEELRHFLADSLGFGDFIFRLPSGQELTRAHDLDEIPAVLASVPVDSVTFHATRNHFSNWCMARTEFALARLLRPFKVEDFSDPERLRTYLIDTFKQARSDARRGLVVDFSRFAAETISGFARIGSGSLGGKGRGLGFIHSILPQEELEEKHPEARVVVPPTSVLGTEVFDEFLRANQLLPIALEETTDDQIARAFLAASLPRAVLDDLRFFLEHATYPLAIRSSSLLEDSHEQPFAGIYRTYMLPNNEADPSVRLARLHSAIKLVYASTFFQNARAYLRSTPFRMEEEKMGVLLQKVVGRTHEHYFYPDIAGVARSQNFYPVLDMKAEDGVAAIALGLGRTVVEGQKAIRFSPARPQVLPQFSDNRAFLENSQREFYAMDLDSQADLGRGEDGHIALLPIDEAEKHETLHPIGSVYSANNDAVYDGISRPGVRLVTFRRFLASQEFPLGKILQSCLEMASRRMACPVEMEFAVNLKPEDGGRPEFNIVQVRPMSERDIVDRIAEIPEDIEGRCLCASDNALGNGRIPDIKDIIYVRPSSFDRGQTPQIASEVGDINRVLRSEDRNYLLIGPGRWGTADRWLGIPVQWSDISQARAIVESDLSEIPVTPSEGTHFFQNLISFGIGYFHVKSKKAHAEQIRAPRSSRGEEPEKPPCTDPLEKCRIDFQWLDSLPAVHELPYVRHVRLDQPLEIFVDGRSRKGVILRAREGEDPLD
ncbi:MAG: PEP/pyruvate-binding domain-containing protein [Candidatus Eisenbacteria bacterium]